MAWYIGPFEDYGDEQAIPCQHLFLGAAIALVHSPETTKIVYGPAKDYGSLSVNGETLVCAADLFDTHTHVLKQIEYIQVGGGHAEFFDYTDPEIPPTNKPEDWLLASANATSFITHTENAPTVPSISYGTVNPRGEARVYDDEPLWSNEGWWTWPYSIVKAELNFVTYSQEVSPCPPGTVYNPASGTCDVLDDYQWDPTTETYVLARCLDVVGQGTICDRGTYTYTIRYWNKLTEELLTFSEDKVIYLSYPASTVKNNLHFTAPSSVVLPAGQSTVDIEIVLYNNENGYFHIYPESDGAEPCEGAYIIYVDCDAINEENAYDGVPCCNFVPKDYIGWVKNSTHNQWMTCYGFNEAEYPGNMLKDGTILEVGDENDIC